ncbi:hypothetical protein ACFL0M_09775 [Thermodesulfobacteriota bacterium]
MNVIDTLYIINGRVTGPAVFIAPQYIATYRSNAQLKRRILKMVLKIGRKKGDVGSKTTCDNAIVT